ncbi:hypothetical protein [Chitinophaga sancti]|uniref:Uncharacterized protein n=1 Tax=Chitinophaga sancti TaxID=1004 RepID=A0A1K1MTX0_9BACT|nr:hypothetical protein [Chitinophaga sancti]WQD62972.1 hypothetical protein U0033_01095 [Chitinophaga sancti]WQG91403.1 hypothetical protein SR876_07820 [Chitinophaga sancti]SFW26461.1 hypothetical protein SAMN05661012_00873 [Chitinophaga sancti]
MRYLLFMYLLITTTVATAQRKNDAAEVLVMPLHIDRAKGREDKLVLLADSLNNYKGGILPDFLFDACIDWNASYWKDLHAATSVRWLILKHVTNKQSLKLIIDQHDKRLDELCRKKAENVYPYLKIPMIKKSFYQLIKDRRKELSHQ